MTNYFEAFSPQQPLVNEELDPSTKSTNRLWTLIKTIYLRLLGP